MATAVLNIQRKILIIAERREQMASTIGAYSYVKNDGSLSTSDDINTNLSSTGKSKNSSSKTILDVDQFLQLMVAEMQNQDPLEPTDNSSYMAQLATFTQ